MNVERQAERFSRPSHGAARTQRCAEPNAQPASAATAAPRSLPATALRLLAEAGVALAAPLDERATAGRIARLLVPALCDHCTVELFEPGRPVASASAHADPTRALRAPLPARTALDLDPCQAMGGDAEPLRALTPTPAVALRLLARGGVLGVLTLATEAPGGFAASDLALARELAQRIALAIENARLHRELQEAIRLRDELLALACRELRAPLGSLGRVFQGLRASASAGPTERLSDVLERVERPTSPLTRILAGMQAKRAASESEA
jgi:GAF domain-containing protein